MDASKVKASKEEFTQVLYYWLSQRLAKQAIKKTAKDLDFKIKSNEDFNKVFQELFALNMWLIVRSCEKVFDDIDKRNECLDIFHKFVYDRHTDKLEENFSKWKKTLSAKYIEYIDAMETEHPVNPLWVLAKIINKNLFRGAREDVLVQTHIAIYVVSITKHLPELIEKYEII